MKKRIQQWICMLICFVLLVGLIPSGNPYEHLHPENEHIHAQASHDESHESARVPDACEDALYAVLSFFVLPISAAYEDGVECEFCGGWRYDDWKCDNGDHCGDGADGDCYSEHHCGSCGDCVEDNGLCDDCEFCFECCECENKCRGCYEMGETICKECGEKCSGCDWICDECEKCTDCIGDETYCSYCDICIECADWICYCGDGCSECAFGCEDCREKCTKCAGDELCLYCWICFDCVGGDGDYCAECHKCKNCVDVVCACGTGCSECAYVCPECGEYCENCADGYICMECGICDDCAGGDNNFCHECLLCKMHVDYICFCGGGCSNCAAICPECSEKCEACADDQLCGDCGVCFECVGGEGNYCEECGVCKNCVERVCCCGGGCSGCTEVCPECAEKCMNCADDELCSECGVCFECVGGEGNYCVDCGVCKNCVQICYCGNGCVNCAGVCPECFEKCTNCAEEEICGGCNICKDCAGGDGNFCDNCETCKMCSDYICICGAGCSECVDFICPECNEKCSECAPEEICGGCNICKDCAGGDGNFCDNCGTCKMCSEFICVCGGGCSECVERICPECNDKCSECADDELCSDCGICADCVGEGNFCYNCSLCITCVEMVCACGNGCSNCAIVCMECCEACSGCTDDYCQECGKCYFCAESDSFCVNCHYCGDCAVVCPCGEGCENCADLCPDCAEMCSGCSDEFCASCDRCINCVDEILCESCHLCGDCTDICADCGVICFVCAESVCDGCGKCADCLDIFCPDCGICIDCADALCQSCNLCGDCTAICDVCGEVCGDCAVLCEECGICDGCRDSSEMKYNDDRHWYACSDLCDAEWDAEPHRFGAGQITEEATEDHEGILCMTCLDCGCQIEETIPQTDSSHVHIYQTETIAPTCSDDGYILHTCSCGHTWKDNMSAAVGHEMEYRRTEDEHWQVCTVCGAETEKTAHKVTAWNTVRNPGYTYDGCRKGVCVVCGADITETVPALTVPEDKYVMILPADIIISGGTPAVVDGAPVYEILSKGSDHKVPALPMLAPDSAGKPFSGWIDKDTGKPVHKGDPMTGNLTLIPVWSEKDDLSTLPFTDVGPDDYFAQAVKWAYENNITAGTSETTFSPDMTCTRAQVVTFLWRAAGYPEPKSAKNPFTDVRKTDWYYKAVLWAVEQNITQGTSKSTFTPTRDCSTAEILTFLFRSVGAGTNGYYEEAAAWAESLHLVQVTGLAVNPTTPCPRKAIVSFLYGIYG